MTIRLNIDAPGAISKVWPILESGIDTEIISPDEAADLLLEAVLNTITVVEAPVEPMNLTLQGDLRRMPGSR